MDWKDELNIDIFMKNFLPTLVGEEVRQGNKKFIIKAPSDSVRRGLRVPVLIKRDNGGSATITRYGGSLVRIIGIEEIGSTPDNLPSLQDLLDGFSEFKKRNM